MIRNGLDHDDTKDTTYEDIFEQEVTKTAKTRVRNLCGLCDLL
jgi:hypothetical protein